MQEPELKATELIGSRVRAKDGEAGAVRDLVVDAGAWVVRYLVVGADAWPAGHEALVAPRSVSGIDEARRELTVDLTVQQVRASPALAADLPVTREFEENWHRFHGWEAYWQAEVDETAVPEPPTPPAPPAEEPLPAAVSAEDPGLLRLENLRAWRAETTDGVPVAVVDLLLDETDWSVDYLEVEIGHGDERELCLIDRSFIVGADPVGERFFLSVDAKSVT